MRSVRPRPPPSPDHHHHLPSSPQVQPREPGHAGALRGDAGQGERLRPGGQPGRAEAVRGRRRGLWGGGTRRILPFPNAPLFPPPTRYQFNPAFFQTTVTAQILLKALTNLPHTDFTLCKCMIDQAHVSATMKGWLLGTPSTPSQSPTMRWLCPTGPLLAERPKFRDCFWGGGEGGPLFCFPLTPPAPAGGKAHQADPLPGGAAGDLPLPVLLGEFCPWGGTPDPRGPPQSWGDHPKPGRSYPVSPPGMLTTHPRLPQQALDENMELLDGITGFEDSVRKCEGFGGGRRGPAGFGGGVLGVFWGRPGG